MDQKSNDKPQPITAKVQTDNPTPISRNGFTLQEKLVYTSKIWSRKTWLQVRYEAEISRNMWLYVQGKHYYYYIFIETWKSVFESKNLMIESYWRVNIIYYRNNHP